MTFNPLNALPGYQIQSSIIEGARDRIGLNNGDNTPQMPQAPTNIIPGQRQTQEIPWYEGADGYNRETGQVQYDPVNSDYLATPNYNSQMDDLTRRSREDMLFQQGVTQQQLNFNQELNRDTRNQEFTS